MRRLLLASLLLPCAFLLACSTGIDSGSNDLPEPAVFAAEAPRTCSAAGSAAITLDPGSVIVHENWVGPDTAGLGPHQAEVTFTLSGLPAGNAVYAVALDDATSCSYATTTLAAAADGTHTARMRISVPATNAMVSSFRVVIVSGPAGATIACPVDDDCLGLTSGAASAPFTGISNAVGVRL